MPTQSSGRKLAESRMTPGWQSSYFTGKGKSVAPAPHPSTAAEPCRGRTFLRHVLLFLIIAGEDPLQAIPLPLQQGNLERIPCCQKLARGGLLSDLGAKVEGKILRWEGRGRGRRAGNEEAP